MKNQGKIEELLADLLRSNDRLTEGQIKLVEGQAKLVEGQMDTNKKMDQLIDIVGKNFVQIDDNFKVIVRQLERMNDNIDRAIALEEKVKTLEERLSRVENKVL